MAEISVQVLGKDGLTASYTAAGASGDTYVNGPLTYFEVNNGSTGGITVTALRSKAFTTKENYGQLDIANIAVAVGNGAVAGFKAPLGSHSPGGIVNVTYSDATAITVRAVRLVRD